MSTDIGTNQPASAGAGVQDANPSGYEADAGASDADQGLADQSDGDLPEEGEGEAAPELDEFEHEGRKHQIPKALRELLDKGADYTRKTQEHAEAVRAREQEWATREQDFAHRAQASQHLQQGHATVAALDLQLKQYDGINWAVAAQNDPTAANQAWIAYSQLKDQRQAIAGQLQQAEQHFLSTTQQQATQRVQQAVSKWSPEEQAAVNAVAKDYNLTPQVLTGVFGQHPMLLTILRDAALHRQASAKAATALKPVAPKATAPAGKLPQGNGNATPRRLDDPNMPMDEWLRRRNEQVRRSRRK